MEEGIVTDGYRRSNKSQALNAVIQGIDELDVD